MRRWPQLSTVGTYCSYIPEGIGIVSSMTEVILVPTISHYNLIGSCIFNKQTWGIYNVGAHMALSSHQKVPRVKIKKKCGRAQITNIIFF